MIGSDGSSTAPRTAFALIGLVAAFCAVSYSRNHYWDEYFYLYSVWQHPIRDLMAMEGALSDGLFPNGFFSGKIAFVFLLDTLVAITGAGPGGLTILRGIFTGVLLGVVFATWLVARELVDASAAWKAALVAMFLPIPLYLGFKVLSEGPALLLATLGGWQLLVGLRNGGGRRFAHLLAAAIALALATCMRLTAVLFPVGLAAALVVWRPSRIPLRRVWQDVALVLAAQTLIVVMVTGPFIGWPFERFSGLADSVTSRRPDPLMMVYGPALSVQFFFVAAIAALRRPLQGPTRAALVWILVGFVPYLIAARYLEPRYFYTATLPMALLCAVGLERVAAAFPRYRRDVVWIVLLATTVVLNRIVLAPVMLYEIDEDRYSSLLREVRAARPSASYVTPWLSDFCYLSFAFPSERVALALSDTYGTGRVFSQPEFQRWLGKRPYVGGMVQLAALPRPWIYVGWDFSPTVQTIDRRLRLVGLRYLDDPTRRGRLLNHLSPSWIWSSDELRLAPVDAVGHYQAFEILPRESR